MKKLVLGIDVGVSSLGFAVIDYHSKTNISIKEMFTRIIPSDPDFHGKFVQGATASKNLSRTIKRGARRGVQRWKLRRDQLHKHLRENGMDYDQTLRHLDAMSLYGLRSKAVEEEITLPELGRVFAHMIQRRGFLSNRKSQSEEENSTDYKKRIAELQAELQGMTIGQRLYQELSQADHPQQVYLRNRTYLRSDYIDEYNRIWECQKQYHPDVLTGGPGDKSKSTLYSKLGAQTLFYQRRLKSQKHLVSMCSFEPDRKVCPKTSPLYEYFRVWQQVNDTRVQLPDMTWVELTDEQKQSLSKELLSGTNLNKVGKLSLTKVKKILGYKANQVTLNFEEYLGSKTYLRLYNALVDVGYTKSEAQSTLAYDPLDFKTKKGLYPLWHLFYSIEEEKDLTKALIKQYSMTQEQAQKLSSSLQFGKDYGRLSATAIRKLLPYMMKGIQYSSACDEVGYDHSGYKSNVDKVARLSHLTKNSLRNPVVEQTLNQIVNVVNMLMDKYGAFDEIRIELARELKNSAKTRANISKSIRDNRKRNEKVRTTLTIEYQYKNVNGRDVQRYKLWEETGMECLYCAKKISQAELLNGTAEKEHILPKSRSFTNSMSNFILSHRSCNQAKNQDTAYDYMASKGDQALADYLARVQDLYADGKISKSKYINLTTNGDDIPSDFVNRMLKDTQYIAVETVKMLKQVCDKVTTTTGTVTDYLRATWGLNRVLQELMLPKYKAIGMIEEKEVKQQDQTTKKIEVIKGWSKRDDHRHHAIDAVLVALTDPKIIYFLNNKNKLFQAFKRDISKQQRQDLLKYLDTDALTIKEFSDLTGLYIDCPIPDLRDQVRKHLREMLISFQKSSRVISTNINSTKPNHKQLTYTPRGALHKETIMGEIKTIDEKKVSINQIANRIDEIAYPQQRIAILNHLNKYNGDLQIAFSNKTLKKDPIIFKGTTLREVTMFKKVRTKRVGLTPSITKTMVSKICDSKVQEIIQSRIKEKGGIKKAFSALENDPIYLNKEKNITIKSVTVEEEKKAQSVREGYALYGENHHLLVYKSDEGKWDAKIVPLWEAFKIARKRVDLPVGHRSPIVREDTELGKFMFSLMKKDLVVLDLKHSSDPTEDGEVNFLDPANRALISEKLFRVQSISLGNPVDITIRHHLEATLSRNELTLKGVSWGRLRTSNDCSRITKIHLDPCGNIVKVGE